MLTGALATFAAALIVIVASAAIGAGVLAACGGRRWSWTAPAIGLAGATVVAWWAVRLPGHGLTALLVLAALAAAAGFLAMRRLRGLREAALEAAPLLAVSLLGVAIPFVAEGHFGVLGTGFNVDMSQHLFAADWLADPSGSAPGLFAQGYPLGPHALAVATNEVSGGLPYAFSGVTIAIPVIVALTALAGLREWSWWRATLTAALTAFAYLAASYLAQGSFKELFEIAFLLGFALWLRDFSKRAPLESRTWRAGLPGAVLAAGALYAYSGPGLAWLGGTLLLWAGIELTRRGDRAAALRRVAPALVAGIVALLVLAAPELDRIADFGGSVGTVNSAKGGTVPVGPLLVRRGPRQPGPGKGGMEGPKFDNDLGNLFGQISPLEALEIWPSGDFRVAPGDGAVPAVLFYIGALIGALALGLGVLAAVRAGETAMPAALAAALAIWLAARIGSTPYTAAKALAILAPPVMLVAARGLLAPRSRTLRSSRTKGVTVLAAAFVAAAGGSTVLALANAPIGPGDYTPGVRELAGRFAGRPTLLIAPDDVIADQHGREFYGWELREASRACVAPMSVTDPSAPVPAGLRQVITVQGGEGPPFAGLTLAESRDGVTVWSRSRHPAKGTLSVPDRAEPTDCI